jgi:hypothetical protein
MVFPVTLSGNSSPVELGGDVEKPNKALAKRSKVLIRCDAGVSSRASNAVAHPKPLSPAGAKSSGSEAHGRKLLGSSAGRAKPQTESIRNTARQYDTMVRNFKVFLENMYPDLLNELALLEKSGELMSPQRWNWFEKVIRKHQYKQHEIKNSNDNKLDWRTRYAVKRRYGKELERRARLHFKNNSSIKKSLRLRKNDYADKIIELLNLLDKNSLHWLHVGPNHPIVLKARHDDVISEAALNNFIALYPPDEFEFHLVEFDSILERKNLPSLSILTDPDILADQDNVLFLETIINDHVPDPTRASNIRHAINHKYNLCLSSLLNENKKILNNLSERVDNHSFKYSYKDQITTFLQEATKRELSWPYLKAQVQAWQNAAPGRERYPEFIDEAINIGMLTVPALKFLLEQY